ncbi:uncharacterized protein EI90DRAFT_3131904 [Cantharellus anzutake]|uniref:uncharacterized protein n=1 Tax=Cantharellus anzutake TaxID=1750568 RepID=UPI00190828E5|nr:uncharacterized protein EI90DRAFT_3131904 [Cantharellus anzutake]KAF8320536.1 hypothetical protein EI90DRAFT_3131904 [Cantharellus anzutake]
MSDSQPSELTQQTNSGLPALVRSPPSNSSVPNSAELPLEEKRGEANIDSSSGESDTAEPKVPKVPAKNIKPKPPPLDSRSLNVNLSSNQQGQVYRRSQTHSSLQAARLALQIKELQLQQAAVLGPRSNGDGTLTVPFSAPRTPTSPTQPPRFPLPPIPPMTPLTANQITNAEPLHADYQPLQLR